tara:strand:+ start:1289 stop:1744 length:456 start_codon:yes stop_codon:yes gene_type:complete
MADKNLEFRSVRLSPNEVLKFWPEFEADIEKALAHSVNELTAFDLCKAALDGKIYIWLTLDKNNKIVCTTTTRFLNYPSHKSLQIITCTGRNQKWEEFFEQHSAVEDFARQNDCSSIQIWGRKGWQRQLKKLTSNKDTSYNLLYYVYNMEI